jgi:3',5'-cyclic AMP phosphodiesterase CpdA
VFAEKFEAIEREIAAYRKAHPDLVLDDGNIAYRVGRGDEYQDLLKELDKAMKQNLIGQKR